MKYTPASCSWWHLENQEGWALFFLFAIVNAPCLQRETVSTLPSHIPQGVLSASLAKKGKVTYQI